MVFGPKSLKIWVLRALGLGLRIKGFIGIWVQGILFEASSSLVEGLGPRVLGLKVYLLMPRTPFHFRVSRLGSGLVSLWFGA